MHIEWKCLRLCQSTYPWCNVSANNTETGVVTTGMTTKAALIAFLVCCLCVQVTAELPGFQTQSFTDVRLGNAAQARLNFTLAVARQHAVQVTVWPIGF